MNSLRESGPDARDPEAVWRGSDVNLVSVVYVPEVRA